MPMKRSAIAPLLLFFGGASAGAESLGYNLRASVPTHCVVEHHATGVGATASGPVALGNIKEFCNSPRGHKLVVQYTPGSLLGAVVVAGEDRVVLNGSGEAILSLASGPTLRTRTLSILADDTVLSTAGLQLRMQPR